MKDNKSSFMILIPARIKDKPNKQTIFTKYSGYNAREVNCSCVYKNRCISVCLVSVDNSHDSFLWPEYFIGFLRERWIPFPWQAVTYILLVFTLPPRDSTVY